VKRILIIAGPNGAGKTTFARAFLPEYPELTTFINADLIAAGLSPFDPDRAAIQAGRLMLEMIDSFVEEGRSFSFETTLSGLSYATKTEDWRRRGYQILLIFISLPDADMAVSRVAERVRQGGHNIPEHVARRRFLKGLDNFERVYRNLADNWLLMDNSGDDYRIQEGSKK
jgi:predicted ABC-type ATPase